MHRQCRERAGGEKGNKRWREGGKGGLAGCGVHNRGRWMERERGILGKDDGREEDGRWGFYMCGRRERKGGIGGCARV